MGLGSCPICTEPLKDGVVATKCGHVFHELCVATWLANNRQCPTCRATASTRSLLKLFLASNDESIVVHIPEESEDKGVELEKCRKIITKLKNREEDMKATISVLKGEAEENSKAADALTQNYSLVQHNLKKAKTTISNLNMKMKYMSADVEERKKLEERCVRLEREVKGLKGLQVLLEGSAEEVEDLVKTTGDPESLALYVNGLKRDYAKLQRAKAEEQAQTEALQRKLSYSRLTITKIQQELSELKREKAMVEGDLSLAERRNESLCKKIGAYEDKSVCENTDLLNVTKPGSRKSFETPVHLNKRQRKEHSTPMDADDSFSSITRSLENELSRDDELDRIAAELGVDIELANSPKTTLPSQQHRPKDNLFSREGFDGFGGRGKVPKPPPASRSMFAKQANKQSTLAKKATLNNMFRKY
eukprot:sb/3465041/